MLKKVKPANMFLFVIFIAVVIMTFTIIKYNKTGEYLNKYVLSEFSTPWVYINKDSNEKNISLPTTIKSKPNAVIVIENTVPVSAVLDDYCICFRSKQQFVKAYINGKEIYSYGYHDAQRVNKGPTSAWQMIPIRKQDQGKELRIELRSPYKQYMGVISNIVYCNRYDYQAYILKTYIPGFVVSCVLISLGVFIFLVAILSLSYKSEFRTLFYISLCTILLGLWSLGESKVTQFLYDNLNGLLLMTILSIMLAPFPYLLYMKELLSDKNKKYVKYMMAVMGVNFIRCIVMQLVGVRDLIESVNSSSFLSLISLIIIHILLILEYYKQQNKKVKMYRAAYLSMTGILALFSLVEAWAYYSNVFKEYGLFLRIGILLYMAVMTLTFVARYMDLIEEANTLRNELINSQVSLMLSQIQPHFLYNTLTAIRTLIKRKPDEAYTLVGHFSKYLRTNLNSINKKDLIPFTEELNHIKTYVYIELVRFSHQFEVVYDIDVEDFLVPPLSIQPIVENAIKHGVCKIIEGGIVTIRTREINNTVIVEIIDNGIGFNYNEYSKSLDDTNEEEATYKGALGVVESESNVNGEGKHNSIGLRNIKMRLTKLCNATFKIQSIEGCGTIVSVVFPR